MTLAERVLILVAFLILLSLPLLLPHPIPESPSSMLIDTVKVPGDFAAIQDAIDAAVVGARIEVDARFGPYVGSLSIVTPGVTLQSVNGRAIIDAQGESQYAIFIAADNVQFRGFEVLSSSMGIHAEHVSGTRIADNWVHDAPGMGVMLIDVSESVIEQNVLTRNFHGIWVSSNSVSCLIQKNEVKGHSGVGVAISGSQQIEVRENIIEVNRLMGIELLSASGNRILRNQIRRNLGAGINFEEAANGNLVEENIVEGNTRGIWLLGSHDNIISRNAVSGHEQVGIQLDNSGRTEVSLNHIESNHFGITLTNAGRSWVHQNKISDNDIGIRVVGVGATLEISMNNIVNNVELSLENRSEDRVNAINNYWGSESGPGEGSDEVAMNDILGSVEVDPWATAPFEIEE